MSVRISTELLDRCLFDVAWTVSVAFGSDTSLLVVFLATVAAVVVARIEMYR